MGPYLEAFGAIAKLLGWTFGSLAVMTVLLVVFIDVWTKYYVRGRIYAFFLEQRHLTSKIVKPEGDYFFHGRGESKEKYLLDDKKQFWTWWPPGVPRLVQTPVRTHWYIKNCPEPFDPSNLKSIMSSKSLRMISDEAMLKQTWKDVRETTGAGARIGGGSWLLWIVLLAIALLGGFNLYITLDIQKYIGG